MGFYSANKDDVGGGAQLTPFWKFNNAYAGQPFVIIGGGTSVGQFGRNLFVMVINCFLITSVFIPAIQLARLNGFSPIITTASVKHTEYLTALGASHVLSRDLPAEALAAEIAKITTEPLKVVFAAMLSPETVPLAWSLVATGGQLIAGPMQGQGPKDGEDGKRVAQVWGSPHYPGQAELGRELYGRLTQLLADGSIKVCPCVMSI
jgi:hypothetical protein